MADLVLRCVVGLVIFAGVCALLVRLAAASARAIEETPKRVDGEARPAGHRVSFRIVRPVNDEILADALESAGAFATEITPDTASVRSVSLEVSSLEALFDVMAVAEEHGLAPEPEGSLAIGGAPDRPPSDDWHRVVAAHASGTSLRVALGAPIRVEVGGELRDAWQVRVGALSGVLHAHGAPTSWSSSPPAEVDAWVAKYDQARGVLELWAWCPLTP